MKRSTRVLAALLVVVGILLAYWLAGPLFVTTRSDVPAPEAFDEIVKEGAWVGQDDFHFASGAARILGDGSGAYILRLEEFRVRNGPDIEFFLSADAVHGPDDVGLGDVPATTGSYNVPIPAGTDVGSANYVLVYCVPFRVLFATAALA